MTALDAQALRQKVVDYILRMNTGRVGEFRHCESGKVTAYASCFAAMTLHYLGVLNTFNDTQRKEWVSYLNGWQDPRTGRYVGPEVAPQDLTSSKHDLDHVTMHLTSHVLPALNLLGGQPAYPLTFARRFLQSDALLQWIRQRNWREAWMEGNNLLFVGQFLVHLRDVEQNDKAESSLKLYFDWLDRQQDPATGLWGTNGFCDSYRALYGAYHQLLVYYYCGRRVPFARRIIDTVLKLQHEDGSFTPAGGGGACEDVDAVDVLVNLHERTGFRPVAIRRALVRAMDQVLRQQMPDGGFVYRRGVSFVHLGIKATACPPDCSNLFSTWFRVHTIALACQILRDHPLAQTAWFFNDQCSMGWHDTNATCERVVNVGDYLRDWMFIGKRKSQRMTRRSRLRIQNRCKRLVSLFKNLRTL